MASKKSIAFQNIFLKGLPIFMALIGGLFLLFSFFFWERGIMPILPGIFTESVAVPISFVQLATELIPIELENFLLFQNFESLPPIFFPNMTLLYGAVIWLLFNIGLSLISTLKKMYFIGATALVIFLLAFSGINGLDIGGISSNYALISILFGVLLPIVLISFFAGNWGILPRFMVIFISGTITLYIMGAVSNIPSPWIWLSENAAFPAAVISTLFLLHIGHVIISGSAVFLIKLNKGTGLKISFHLILIFLIYFLLILFTLLDTMGEVNLPFPTLPPVLLMLVCGLIGIFIVRLKIEQTDQAFDAPVIGESFYWTGFAITVWTWGRAIFIENEPLYEFLNHIFLYSQLSLCLLFFIYLMSNFSQILNSGKDVERILFKPQYFAYFHMRIGSIMGLVILTVYADGIIGSQLASASTNITADYYGQTDRPLEAAILYENSWLQYRRNDKAKNAAAHFRFNLKQPQQGMDHLLESFNYSPNVPNILLLSAKTHQQDKVLDALFYLEKGLEYYPGNPYLINNISLLYSKINRPIDALAKLEEITKENIIAQSNKLALQIKHGLKTDESPEIPDDLIFKINYLAGANKKGDFTDFVLDTHQIPEGFSLKAALFRNQWSNKIETPLEEDLILMDSLVALEQPGFEERNFRETRILRMLQQSYINETLKYINGTAMVHPDFGAYYHEMAAKILAGQLDFEKAAIDILVASESGFINFKPFHLAILYFGNKAQEAKTIESKYEVSFPSWMKFDSDGILEKNDLSEYYQKISRLHQSLPGDFLADLDALDQNIFQEEFAYHILVHKLHWLKKPELEKVKNIITAKTSSVLTKDDIDSWYAFVHSDTGNGPSEKIMQLFQLDKDLERNAYWTPFVWKKVNEENDELRKYELLQEAIQFNKDPFLWIQYVKQSRKIGLDSYGSTAMAEMRGWLSAEQIEKLQMDNF
ncbi:tetratricopeptide repeat protein [Aquiflexum sp.]|uniref:tetratricopeptide repeat protein n=1 Tax=Aquiflexum sp. TaxID=1872584 RepID=UPI003593E4B4